MGGTGKLVFSPHKHARFVVVDRSKLWWLLRRDKGRDEEKGEAPDGFPGLLKDLLRAFLEWGSGDYDRGIGTINYNGCLDIGTASIGDGDTGYIVRGGNKEESKGVAVSARIISPVEACSRRLPACAGFDNRGAGGVTARRSGI